MLSFCELCCRNIARCAVCFRNSIREVTAGNHDAAVLTSIWHKVREVTITNDDCTGIRVYIFCIITAVDRDCTISIPGCDIVIEGTILQLDFIIGFNAQSTVFSRNDGVFNGQGAAVRIICAYSRNYDTVSSLT